MSGVVSNTTPLPTVVVVLNTTTTILDITIFSGVKYHYYNLYQSHFTPFSITKSNFETITI